MDSLVVFYIEFFDHGRVSNCFVYCSVYGRDNRILIDLASQFFCLA
jgi:hypothetical protein